MSKRSQRGKNRPQVHDGRDGAVLRSGELGPLPGSVISGYASQQISYSGPIPPPGFMRQYDEIVPGMAERLLALTERQTNHRIEMESLAIRSGIKRAYMGQLIGGVIGMTAICFGGTAILLGHGLFGSIFGGSGLVSLVSVFVVGKKSSESERVKKDAQMKRK